MYNFIAITNKNNIFVLKVKVKEFYELNVGIKEVKSQTLRQTSEDSSPEEVETV